MSVIKSLHNKLEFTQEEMERYEIKSDGNTVYWKPGSRHEIVLNLTNLELEEIGKAISEADKQKAITVHMVATIEKFTNG